MSTEPKAVTEKRKAAVKAAQPKRYTVPPATVANAALPNDTRVRFQRSSGLPEAEGIVVSSYVVYQVRMDNNSEYLLRDTEVTPVEPNDSPA